MDHTTITEQEVYEWCGQAMLDTTQERAIAWLTEILNGEYSLEDAREDVMSFREFINKPRPTTGQGKGEK